MAAVARQLIITPHALDLHLAYNTKRKRGLHWWGRANAVPRERVTLRHGEATDRPPSRGGGGAPSLNGSEAGASEATMRTLRRLMAASVSTVMARSKE